MEDSEEEVEEVKEEEKENEEEEARRGPLPAEQVASAQSHEVDLAGAPGANRGEEHLRGRTGSWSKPQLPLLIFQTLGAI